MKSHILRLTTKGVNQCGETLYAAHCQLGCWSGTMTAMEARAKQGEHVGCYGAERAGEGCQCVDTASGS